ncbi:MAG: glycosyltransferase, partial [Ignavibacteriae bacterium]|nr:glycosyltransferase [Ignavibacteriota bacterium]
TELVYTDTVYNGINENEFTFREKRGRYLLYFGRIHHDKGTFESIQIAKKARIRLIISGLIQDESYYNEKVKPYIDGESVIYAGNSGPEKRDRLLGEALALLHPVNFNEPFGLSVVESFFCGTPVIAYERGAMRELITHGESGFLVNNVDEAAKAVQSIDSLSRRGIRNYAMSRFTRDIMAEKYFQIYERVLCR